MDALESSTGAINEFRKALKISLIIAACLVIPYVARSVHKSFKAFKKISLEVRNDGSHNFPLASVAACIPSLEGVPPEMAKILEGVRCEGPKDDEDRVPMLPIPFRQNA